MVEKNKRKRVYVVTHMHIDNENCLYYSEVEYVGYNRKKAYETISELYLKNLKEFTEQFTIKDGYTHSNKCRCSWGEFGGIMDAKVEVGGFGMNYISERFCLSYRDI